MADVEIRDFLPLVLQHAPALPQPVAIEHLRQAAIEFCTETRAWRHTVVVPITANPTAIPTPVNAVVFEIERAEWAGQPLEAASTLDFTYDEMMAAAGTSPPCYFLQEHPDEVVIMPLMAGDLTLRLFLKPPAGVAFGGSALRNTLPDFMLNHHAQFIAFGALASALILPDEAFADPKRASYFQSQFQGRIDAMRSGFRTGQQKRRLRSKKSPWL